MDDVKWVHDKFDQDSNADDYEVSSHNPTRYWVMARVSPDPSQACFAELP